MWQNHLSLLRMPNTNVSSSVLSATSHLLISGFIAGSYVGSLYVTRSSRLSFVKTSTSQHEGNRARQPTERWRDDDGVIRARLKAAVFSTCASCGIVVSCVGLRYDSVSNRGILMHWFGLKKALGRMDYHYKNYLRSHGTRPFPPWI